MSVLSRAQALNQLLQLLLDAKKADARKISVDCAQEGHFAAVSIAGAGGASKRTEVDKSAAAALRRLVEERCFPWPDPGDVIFESSRAGARRLLFAPLSSFRLLADFSTAAGEPPSFTLDRITWSDILPVTDVLVLGDADRRAILGAMKNRKGIILANHFKQTAAIGAAAVLLALRPDALWYPIFSEQQLLEEILPAANNHLIILGSESSDPLEMICNYAAVLQLKHDAAPDGFQKLRLAYAHVRVKRTCGACVKTTAVTSENLSRLPSVFRPLAQETYMFSRGCAKCGNSAYRGTVGLNSVAAVGEELQHLLVAGVPAEVVAEKTYAAGARSLLEDGLQKIYSGLTSFEQVYAAVSNIPAAFIHAAESAQRTAARPAPAPAAVQAPPLPGVSEGERQRGRKKVLIVEDEADQRDVLRIVFKEEGFEVQEAENGRDALRELEHSSIDVILCDVMMPVMNGFDFVKALRENPRFSRLPVVMLTAANNSDDEVSLLSLGADDYCPKNLKRRILLQRVDRLLQRRIKENPVGHMLADKE